MSIVTGTIRHRNATVWDLTFDRRTEETLGVTANHPLYSETRHAWIPAGDLQLDEVVRTLNGHSTLTARTQLKNAAIASGSALLNLAVEDSRHALTLMRLWRNEARSDVLSVRISAAAGSMLIFEIKADEGLLLAWEIAKLHPYGRAADFLKGRVARAMQAYENAKGAEASNAEAALQVGAILIFDALGAMKAYQAATGIDPVTLQVFSNEERFMLAIEAAIQLGQTAVAGAQMLDQMKGPCGGFFDERCFVGETLVLTGENAPWSYAENIGLRPTENQQMSLAQWCWILGLGSALVAFGAAKLSEDRRKKHGALTSLASNDELFAEDPENRFLDDESGLPRSSVARIRAAEHDASPSVANGLQSEDNSTMIRTHATAAPRSKTRAGFVARGLGIMAAVLLAVGLLLSIRDAGGPPNPISVASADIERSGTSSPRYSAEPIRDIQPIADRVLADNPETDGQAPSDFGEFVASDWRILRLVVPKPDHEWMKVTLARPQVWIEVAKRDSAGRFWLEFKELGIANWANVLAIEPCPEAAVGEGRLVTGKFEHSSAEVIDLHVGNPNVEGSMSNASQASLRGIGHSDLDIGHSVVIGTTSNHPFWSEDRRDFVQAGRLRIGDRLRLRDGSTPVVTAAVERTCSLYRANAKHLHAAIRVLV